MKGRCMTSSASQNTKRYCDIRATSLEEILATCERHIRNSRLMEIDLLREGDGTELDFWYINMFRATWMDLRDDVREMLNGG